jgi:hypothetical protein
LSATLAAVVTAVATTSTPMLEGGRLVVSGNAAATVTAARSVADGRIDVDDPAAATIPADDAASIMLEKGRAIKTETRILVFRCNTQY